MRLRAGLVAITVALAITVSASAAQAAPPTPDFGPAIDGYAANDPQDTCDPTAKPGTVGFRNILNEEYGHHDAGIVRNCGGATSEHVEGRALDYMLDINNSGDRADAEEIIDWLLATDRYGNRHAIARRFGIMYIIWNRQIWSSARQAEGWRPYSGDSPHTDHIHFSFSWDGALKRTSWWTATEIPVEPPPPPANSVTGDRFTDLVATRTDGSMTLFSNNFVRDGGRPYSDNRVIGSGWQNYTKLLQADVTGDNYTDLLGVKADGTMWLFSNNFVRDGGRPYSDVRQVGSNWQNYQRIIPADATGDGYTDLLGVKADGTMWLFSNNFERDDGVPYGDVRQVGSGWQNYERIIAADATGDAYTDLLGVKADGSMTLFSNNFERDGGRPYSDNRVIGGGWQNYGQLIAADATGDGYTDLLGLKADGSMTLFSNNFERDGGRPYSDNRVVGSGWQNYNRVL